MKKFKPIVMMILWCVLATFTFSLVYYLFDNITAPKVPETSQFMAARGYIDVAADGRAFFACGFSSSATTYTAIHPKTGKTVAGIVCHPFGDKKPYLLSEHEIVL